MCEYDEILYKKLVLLVGVILDINEVISHGLVGQLMQDRGDGVKTSLHYQQLGLGLSLVIREKYTNQNIFFQQDALC